MSGICLRDVKIKSEAERLSYFIIVYVMKDGRERHF